MLGLLIVVTIVALPFLVLAYYRHKANVALQRWRDARLDKEIAQLFGFRDEE